MTELLPETLTDWLGDRPRPRPTIEGCTKSRPNHEPSKRELVRWCNRALLALARHDPGDYLVAIAEDLVQAISLGANSLAERWDLIVDSQINVARLQLLYEPEQSSPVVRAFLDLAEKGTCVPGGRSHLPQTIARLPASSAARIRFQALAAYASLHSSLLARRGDWHHLVLFARSFIERWPKASLRGVSEPWEIIAHSSERQPMLPHALRAEHLCTTIIVATQFEIARLRRGEVAATDQLAGLVSLIHLRRDTFAFPDTVDALLTAIAKASDSHLAESPSPTRTDRVTSSSDGAQLRDMIHASLMRIQERSA